jgi:gliding motility-associated-like protein
MQTLTYNIYIADLNPLTLVAPDTFLCSGSSLTLAPLIGGGGGTVTYNWTQQGGGTVGTADTLVVSPTTTTNYIITVSDSCGQGPLVDTITVQVGTSNFITVNADVVGNPVDTIVTEGCDVLKITFTRGGLNLAVIDTFNYVVGGTATNGTDYSPLVTGSVIFPSGGTTQTLTITAANDGINEGANGETITITIPPDTTNPCASQVPQTIVIHIKDLMPIVAQASDTTICLGSSTSISASSTGGGGAIAYAWSAGLGNGPTKNVTPITTTSYVVTVTDNCGSTADTDTATVTVLASLPQLAPLSDVTVCQGSNAALPTIITGGYTPYGVVWTEFLPSVDSVIVINSSLSQINSVQMGGIFIVTITDKCLKSDNDTVMVTVDDCALNIPNIVTPNGDGVNDALYFKNLDKYPNSSIAVFNRWGNRIMESSNYNNQWVPDVVDGVYYFILTVSDGRNFSGYFQVLKHK